MKKILSKLIILSLGIFFSTTTSAQTPGTLTVVYTPTAPSTATFYSGKRNLGAAWIETGTGTFVKTKIKFCGGNCDHLTSSPWQTASAGNTTGADVASGATKTSFAATTFTWNGTNTAGTVVADGNYNIKIFSVWNHGSTSNQLYTSTVGFTKGTTPSTVTPAATNWLTGVTLIWTPATTTGIEENASNPSISVAPNPSNGIFNVDFKNANNIKVFNALGVLVYDEKIEQTAEGTKAIDLSNFSNGMYFINVSNEKGSINHKVILNK